LFLIGPGENLRFNDQCEIISLVLVFGNGPSADGSYFLGVGVSRLPNLFKPDTANRALEKQNPGFASALNE
jgi:hypothetical protein